MKDKDQESSSKHSLDDLDRRLKNAKQGLDEEKSGGFSEASAYSKAMRFISDLLAGVIIGIAIGLALDSYFSTKPLFLIMFLFIGVAAGVVNIARSAKHMAPAIDDDKDDNDLDKE